MDHARLTHRAEDLEGQLALQPVVLRRLIPGVGGDGDEVLAFHHRDGAEIEAEAPPAPDGSSGYHQVSVTVR